MAGENEVQLILKADTKQAADAVSSFAGKANEAIDSVTKAYEGLKFIAEAAVALLGLEKAAEFLGEATRAAVEADTALDRLNISLKLSGQFSEESAKHFEDLATHLAATSTATIPAIETNLALAKSFGLTNEQAEKVIKASLDLSAVTGESLTTAVEQLGRSYNGYARGLSNTIPGVRELTKRQLEAGDAVDLVAKKFAGASEALSSTFGGALQRSKNNFEELLASIGRIITQNPLVIKIIQLFGEGFEALASKIKANAHEIGLFVNDGLVALAQKVPTAIDVIRGISGGMNIFIQVLLEAAKGILLLVKTASQFEVISTAITVMVKILALATTSFLEFVGTVAKLPGASRALEAMGISVQDVQKKIESTNDGLFKLVNEFDAKKLTDGLDSATKSVDGFGIKTNAVFSKVDDGLTDLRDAAQEAADEIEEMGNKQVTAAARASDAIQNQTDQVFRLTQAQRGLITGGASFLGSSFSSFAGASGGGSGGGQVDVGAALATIQAATEKDGQDRIDQINHSRDLEAAALSQRFQAGLISAQQLSEAQTQLGIQTQQAISNQKYQNETALNKKLAEEKAKLEADNAKNAAETQAKQLAAANGIVSSGLGDIANIFLPGIGAAVTSILNVLALGPEKIQQLLDGIVSAVPVVVETIAKALPALINGLIQAIPKLIDALLQGIPAIINALLDGIPQIIASLISAIPDIILSFVENVPHIIEALVEGIPRVIGEFVAKIPQIIAEFVAKIPQIIQALVAEMPKLITALTIEMPKVAARLAQLMPEISRTLAFELIKSAPTIVAGFATEFFKLPARIIHEIADGVKAVFQKIADLLSGKGVVNTVKDVISSIPTPFATGGTIPGGFPNDSFPARVESGEVIIPHTDTDRLRSFLDRQETAGASAGTDNRLDQLTAAIGQQDTARDLRVQLNIGERQLAEVILQLTRQGFRLA